MHPKHFLAFAFPAVRIINISFKMKKKKKGIIIIQIEYIIIKRRREIPSTPFELLGMLRVVQSR